MLAFHLIHHVRDLEPHALLSTLNVLSNTELEKEIKTTDLVHFEQKIISEYPEYLALDLANTITALIRLGYVPK